LTRENRGTKIISIGARSSISVRDSSQPSTDWSKKRPAIAGLLGQFLGGGTVTRP